MIALELNHLIIYLETNNIMENKVPDELLNLFLNDGQEVDGQLPILLML